MTERKDPIPEPVDSCAEFEAALQNAGDQKISLRLYVAGASPRSARAIANLKQICDQYLQGRYELEIIDIYQQPIFAREGQIVAAPTLIRELPPPLRKFIGDLSNIQDALLGVDLRKR